MDEKTKRILRTVAGNLPITERPFDIWAKQAEVTPKEFVKIIEDNLSAELPDGSMSSGCLRRFGAVLRHTKSGLVVNAMVAWSVPAGSEDKTGVAMAAFNEISHCYLRETDKSWPYNIYTMIHADSKEGLKKTIDKISEKTGIFDFKVLETVRELKKTSPNYFDDKG